MALWLGYSHQWSHFSDGPYMMQETLWGHYSWIESTFIFAHLSPIFLEDFIVYVLGGGGGGMVFY